MTLSINKVLLTLIAAKMVSVCGLCKILFIVMLDDYTQVTDYPINVIGDSGATERQVSPDKLYRVAILKNRFVDTILKAREKTLTQVSHVSFDMWYLLCSYYPSGHC